MQFDTFEFAVFFALVYLAYRCFPLRGQNVLLLGASYFFYGFWDWRFLSLLLISTFVDYFAAHAIERAAPGSRLRRVGLGVSVAANLGMLGFFKYFDFFVESFHGMLLEFGIEASLPLLQVTLPVGISFYTFQTLSYTIDVYRGNLRATRDPLAFALFVSFFPQLVAGPIERAANLLPQIENPRRITWEGTQQGAWLIFWGVYKKVFIADNLARFVDAAYNSPSDVSGPQLLLATYAFAFQIYADFSSYTDIARGVSRIMGFELMENFRLPYFAASPGEFWQRWHISLSQWLRDYLYIPLGGSRGSGWFTTRNLMITMLLGGLWHGARWNFVLWGLFHGLLLVAYRYIRIPALQALPERWKRPLAILVMFHWTVLGWFLFRVDSASQIVDFFHGFFSGWLNGASWSAGGSLLAYVVLLLAVQILQWRRNDMLAPLSLPVAVRVALYLILYFSITFGGAFGDKPFIYFQF